LHGEEIILSPFASPALLSEKNARWRRCFALGFFVLPRVQIKRRAALTPGIFKKISMDENPKGLSWF